MAKQVTVYGTPTCPHCIRLKGYLREHGVAFEDVDVSADRARAGEMMKRSGQMGVPVLDIDGEIIVGFEREAVALALGL